MELVDKKLYYATKQIIDHKIDINYNMLGWTMIISIVSLLILVLSYVLFNPLFSDLGTIAYNESNGTYFENDTKSFLNVLNVVAIPGILVLIVFVFAMKLLGTAIRLTNR